jgi:ubiquinone/menaquinone biosynthesis C-methylase UbiE
MVKRAIISHNYWNYGASMSQGLPRISDPQYLRNEQYLNSSNLERRIALHARFSLNPQNWHRWVFDQLDLPPGCRLLELGCGSGALWRENLERLPMTGEIILSDFSDGMVRQAQMNLSGRMAARFQVIDAQTIPYPNESFDCVIANHMLYHVPKRAQALAEMRRVLKPGGRLYAATGGEQHMCELYEMVQKFNMEMAVEGWFVEPINFTLENGQGQLSPWFGKIELRRYANALVVTEVEPLVDYILSTVRLSPGDARRADLRQFILAQMDANGGAIRITIDGGMFIAWN